MELSPGTAAVFEFRRSTEDGAMTPEIRLRGPRRVARVVLLLTLVSFSISSLGIPALFLAETGPLTKLSRCLRQAPSEFTASR